MRERATFQEDKIAGEKGHTPYMPREQPIIESG